MSFIVLNGCKKEISEFRSTFSAADRGRRVVFVTVCEKLVSKISDRVSSRVFYSGLGANPKSTQGQMGFSMAGRSIQMSIASILFIVILSFANVCNGFYLPGSL